MGSVVVSLAAKAEPTASIGELPLSQLGEVEVTSVSKQPENSFQSAAAVYVLTTGDIKRSGATTVPEALRFVPGLEVARIDSNRWAISARGFNREFANKLLVLVDGRSVYTPLFSGTYWDAQDLLIEDIERIEVIRGPGATLWGANAVNGVINIITKDSKYTQGNHASLGFGNLTKTMTELRHGGDLGDNTTSGKRTDTAPMQLANGRDAHNDSSNNVVNFRLDKTTESQADLVWLINASNGESGHEYFSFTDDSHVPVTEEYTYLNSLVRWSKSGEASNSQLQGYIDYSLRRDQFLVDQNNLTLDLDWQQDFDMTGRFNFMWGLGYRYFQDQLDDHQYGGVTLLGYTPDRTRIHQYSGFLQGKYALVPEELSLTLGSKFEHNSYTGFEAQPSIRFSWAPTEDQTVWAAASRAVRIPSQGERTITLVGGRLAPNAYLRAFGNDDLSAEKLNAYELGYRIQPANWISFDVAAYRNVYDDLRSFAFNGTLNIGIANGQTGEVTGIEATTRVMVNPNLMLQASYTAMDMDLSNKAGITDPYTIRDTSSSPHSSFIFLTRYNATDDLYLDANLIMNAPIDRYGIGEQTRADLTVTWKPLKNVEASIIGQNLTDNTHPEFVGTNFAVPTEMPRSVFCKVSLGF